MGSEMAFPGYNALELEMARKARIARQQAAEPERAPDAMDLLSQAQAQRNKMRREVDELMNLVEHQRDSRAGRYVHVPEGDRMDVNQEVEDLMRRVGQLANNSSGGANDPLADAFPGQDPMDRALEEMGAGRSRQILLTNVLSRVTPQPPSTANMAPRSGPASADVIGTGAASPLQHRVTATGAASNSPGHRSVTTPAGGATHGRRRGSSFSLHQAVPESGLKLTAGGLVLAGPSSTGNSSYGPGSLAGLPTLSYNRNNSISRSGSSTLQLPPATSQDVPMLHRAITADCSTLLPLIGSPGKQQSPLHGARTVSERGLTAELSAGLRANSSLDGKQLSASLQPSRSDRAMHSDCVGPRSSGRLDLHEHSAITYDQPRSACHRRASMLSQHPESALGNDQDEKNGLCAAGPRSMARVDMQRSTLRCTAGLLSVALESQQRRRSFSSTGASVPTTPLPSPGAQLTSSKKVGAYLQFVGEGTEGADRSSAPSSTDRRMLGRRPGPPSRLVNQGSGLDSRRSVSASGGALDASMPPTARHPSSSDAPTAGMAIKTLDEHLAQMLLASRSNTNPF